MGNIVRKQEIYSENCAGKEEDIIKAEEYSYAAGKVFGISNHCPSESQK